MSSWNSNTALASRYRLRLHIWWSLSEQGHLRVRGGVDKNAALDSVVPMNWVRLRRSWRKRLIEYLVFIRVLFQISLSERQPTAFSAKVG